MAKTGVKTHPKKGMEEAEQSAEAATKAAKKKAGGSRTETKAKQ